MILTQYFVDYTVLYSCKKMPQMDLFSILKDNAEYCQISYIREDFL